MKFKTKSKKRLSKLRALFLKGIEHVWRYMNTLYMMKSTRNITPVLPEKVSDKYTISRKI